MKTIIIAVVFCLALIPQLSLAQVYRWVDEKGGVHFTDDMTQIPEKYRPKTERTAIPQETGVSKPQPDKAAPGAANKEEPYKDRLGRGEEYWKGQVEAWEKKLSSSQEKVESLRLKYNDLTEKYNASKSSVERTNLRNQRDQVKADMDQQRGQVEEARIMLEKKIPDEAQLYKAKPEWVKP